MDPQADPSLLPTIYSMTTGKRERTPSILNALLTIRDANDNALAQYQEEVDLLLARLQSLAPIMNQER